MSTTSYSFAVSPDSAGGADLLPIDRDIIRRGLGEAVARRRKAPGRFRRVNPSPKLGLYLARPQLGQRRNPSRLREWLRCSLKLFCWLP
jgi:hypothetical protein